MDQSKVKQGIAAYLSRFERSPYQLPAAERQIVQGFSELRGSWFLANAPRTQGDI